MHLRLACTADAPRIAAIYQHYAQSTAVTFASAAPEPEAFARMIASRYPFVVYEEDGLVAGFSYANTFRTKEAFRWDVELTIYLSPDHTGRGAGRALMTALLALLRRLGYQNAYSCITLPNPGSIALHERLGFRQIGLFEHSGYKLGAWHSVVWYCLPLGDLPSDPAEPLSMADLPAGEIARLLT